jgi:hypothetical protein
MSQTNTSLGSLASFRLNVISTRLSSPGIGTFERTKLLAEKLHLLTNAPSWPSQSLFRTPTVASTPNSNSDSLLAPSAPAPVPSLLITQSPAIGTGKDEGGPAGLSSIFAPGISLEELLEIMRTKMDLARTYVATVPPEWIQAEAELTGVETWSRKVSKRIGRSLGLPLNAPDRLWLHEIGTIRREAITELIGVEQALGREKRAERWRSLLSDMDGAVLVAAREQTTVGVES